jgi:hypothetical protein
MAIGDRHGLRVAVHVATASRYEPYLVAATLDARFLADRPTRLIGDRGHDRDALDQPPPIGAVVTFSKSCGVSRDRSAQMRSHGENVWPLHS